MEHHNIKRQVQYMQMVTSMSHLLVNQVECQSLVRWQDNRLISRLTRRQVSQSLSRTCIPPIKSYLMHCALRHQRFFVRNSHIVQMASKTGVH